MRYIALDEADRVLGLPAGVTEQWVALGIVRCYWYVRKGVIVRGIHRDHAQRLVNHRRARAVRMNAAAQP